MDKSSLFAFLRETPFFADLADAHLAKLAELCTTTTIPAGQRMLTMGQEARYFSVLVSGEVVLGIARGQGELVPVDRILPHGFLGWSALLPPHRWSYDAETVQPCEFVLFEGQQIRALCDGDPLFGTAMMTCLAKAIASRLMATRHTLVENYS
jgi:CRP-like cAMP-binding protein